MFKRILLLMVAVAVTVSVFPPKMQNVQAQGGFAADNILIQFSYYLGINPVLTAAELDRGELNRPFFAEYEINPIDLRGTSLSCSAPVLPNDQTIVDAVAIGWQVIITLQNRTYQFRSNFGGSAVIRCVGGEQIDFNGTPRGIGTTISGEAATTAAMNHLSGQLDVGTITIERAENPGEEDPRVFYRWNAFVYLDASLGCPASNIDYDVRDTFAYNVNLTVNGRRYNYRVRGDGGQVIWCRSGRPDTTSIGITFPTTEE